jgi:hypothetical protein
LQEQAYVVNDDISIDQVAFEHPTVDVSMITSALAMTKPQEEALAPSKKHFLFESVTGVNTTHWGLQSGGDFYDLKRHGRWPFAKTTFIPSTGLTRDEAPALGTMFLGKTHFNGADISQIGKCN